MKYEIFKGLHNMWVEYMHEVLDLKRGNLDAMVTPLGHGSKLASADFHGAEFEVVRSRCVSRVGVKGIVVRDSKFTFVIVTHKNQVKSPCFLSLRSYSPISSFYFSISTATGQSLP